MTQPPPITTTHSEAVLPYLAFALLDSGRGALLDDLRAREQVGIATYGAPLVTHNGRNCLADLYDELLDALMYSAQYELETGESLSEDLHEIKRVAIRVKARLSTQGTAK